MIDYEIKKSTAKESLFRLVKQYINAKRDNMQFSPDVADSQVIHEHIESWQDEKRSEFVSLFIKYLIGFVIAVVFINVVGDSNMALMIAMLLGFGFLAVSFQNSEIFARNNYFYYLGKVYKKEDVEVYDSVLESVFEESQVNKKTNFIIYIALMALVAGGVYYTENILFLFTIPFFGLFLLQPSFLVKHLNRGA